MAHLPLSALLSEAFVAFAIEVDNEFEHLMPHRTADRAAPSYTPGAPWLTSVAMWFSCLRFVTDGGTSVAEVERLARTRTNWNGMERWRYITVAPDPADDRPPPPRSDWIVRVTPGGRQAQAIWGPLPGTIEGRWEVRFGRDALERLRSALGTILEQLDPGLPDYLPIIGPGLFSRIPAEGPLPRGVADAGSDGSPGLLVLLSKALLAFAIEFEDDWSLSLAICADVLRLLDEAGVRVRDLPTASGVSREALSMALGFLEKQGLAAVGTDPEDGRARIARLTARGRTAREAYLRRIELIEDRWRSRFGADPISALRAPLERLVRAPAGERSPLLSGLEPYPDGWRASVRRPDTLPHFPLVLHRGGYPDGS